MYASLLPWQRPGMLIVAAEDRGSGQVLEPFRPVADPDMQTIELLPGRSLSGTIRLNDRFREFAYALKRADVAVWWLYRPTGKDLPDAEPIVGGVLLPRTAF